MLDGSNDLLFTKDSFHLTSINKLAKSRRSCSGQAANSVDKPEAIKSESRKELIMDEILDPCGVKKRYS